MKKKIINILFNDFTNDNRVLKESLSLIKGGYEVELVATRFDKTLSKKEKIEGIKVSRFDIGSVKILPVNLFIFWCKFIKNYSKEKIFHCNDLYALPPAYFIKKILNRDVKIIYDCHEHETEAGIYIGKPILKLFAKVFEKIMIKSVDKVITVSESIADNYVKMYGIEKPSLVLNCPKYQEYKKYNLFRKKFNISEDKVIFLYQGEYLPGRGVDNLIDIFKELESKNDKQVLILLVYGDNLDSLKDKIKESKNIYWHDKVPSDSYMRYVASSDWGIYLMENTCKNHDYALPNKIFDYVSAGLPLILSNLKEMSRFALANKVGYIINPEQKEEILLLLQRIDKKRVDSFSSKLQITSKQYCWEEQEKILFKVYNSL